MRFIFVSLMVFFWAISALAQDQAIQQFLAENRFGPYAVPKDTAKEYLARTHGSYDVLPAADAINSVVTDSDCVDDTEPVIDDTLIYTPVDHSTTTTVLDTNSDTVIEEHIARQVFDLNYSAKSLTEAGLYEPEWQAWEEYYFNRYEYSARLEKIVSQHWSMGSWWWQAEVKVDVPNELNRGGPIFFKVDYPWLDSRTDFIFVITKELNQTVITINGDFHGQQASYFFATFVMLLLMVCVGVLVYWLAKLFWGIFDVLVTALANALTNGNGHDVWAWRFSACLVGAALCGIILIVSFI